MPRTPANSDLSEEEQALVDQQRELEAARQREQDALRRLAGVIAAP